MELGNLVGSKASPDGELDVGREGQAIPVLATDASRRGRKSGELDEGPGGLFKCGELVIEPAGRRFRVCPMLECDVAVSGLLLAELLQVVDGGGSGQLNCGIDGTVEDGTDPEAAVGQAAEFRRPQFVQQHSDLVEREAAVSVANQLEHFQAIDCCPRVAGPSAEGFRSWNQPLFDVASDRPRLDTGFRGELMDREISIFSCSVGGPLVRHALSINTASRRVKMPRLFYLF